MSSRPFVFRLERVRSLREREERAAQQALGVTLDRHRAHERALEAAADRREAARLAQRCADACAQGGPTLLALQAWRERTEREEREAEMTLDRHQVEVDACRGEAQRTRQAREALDRLRERQQATHRAEQQRVEDALLDEVALTRHRVAAA